MIASSSTSVSLSSRTTAGSSCTAGHLRRPPAPLAGDDLVLRRPRPDAAAGSAAGSPPSRGSRRRGPAAPSRRRPAAAGRDWRGSGRSAPGSARAGRRAGAGPGARRLLDRRHVGEQRRQPAAQSLALHDRSSAHTVSTTPRAPIRASSSRRQPLVGEAAAARAIVDQRRHRVRRRLAEPHVARDHRVVDQRAQVLSHVRRDLPGQVIASVIHSQHNTLYLEARIGARRARSGPCASAATGPRARRTRTAAGPAPSWRPRAR